MNPPLFGDAAPDDEPLITRKSRRRDLRWRFVARRRKCPGSSESRMPVNEVPIVTSLAPIGPFGKTEGRTLPRRRLSLRLRRRRRCLRLRRS